MKNGLLLGFMLLASSSVFGANATLNCAAYVVQNGKVTVQRELPPTSSDNGLTQSTTLALDNMEFRMSTTGLIVSTSIRNTATETASGNEVVLTGSGENVALKTSLVDKGTAYHVVCKSTSKK